MINYNKNLKLLRLKLPLTKFALFTFFLLFITININSQCVNDTDCDGDGIANSIDLDDDNDGILDTDEFSCPPLASGTITSFIIDNKAQTTSNRTVNSFSNSSSPFASNTSYNLSYGTKFGKRLEGFVFSSGNTIKVDEDASIGNITFRRNLSGPAPTNQIIWIENDGHTNTTNATKLHTNQITNMVETFSHGFYNVGSDNVFDNSLSSQNNNDIERVDVTFDNGYLVNSADNQYVTVGERGKNNVIDIAIITSVDGSGTPTSYSTVYRATTASMTTIEKLPSTVLRKEISDTNFRPSTALNQDVAIRAIKLSDFGITNGTIIYGYSILPPDYNTANILDWNTYPTNTNATLGGLDLVLFNYFSSDCVSRDTDGDGLPDSKDTDSDNDGCPDAIEAAGSFTNSTVTNTLIGGSNGGSLLNFPTPVNNNGIPTVVGTTIGGNETTGQANSSFVTTAEQITINTAPISTTVNENDNASFSVNASSISTTSFAAGNPDYSIPPATNSTSTLAYNWFKNSAPTTSLSTSNTLNLNTVSFADAGDYTLVITAVNNSCPEERTVTLTVNDVPTATNDTFNANQNSQNNSLDVLDNDSFGNDGPNTGTISLPSGTSTNGGTVTIDDGETPNDPTDDKVLYTPLAGSIANDTFTYTITDADGETSTATVSITVSPVVDCNESPTAPAQGFNVFVETNMDVINTETRGSVAVGGNLNIKGDYNVATDDCGDFDTNGLKTGLLVGNQVNYPLNTVINTNDDQCNCGDPTIVNNGSFETGAVTNSYILKNESDIPGWYTTATDNKIEIWKSGFQGKNAQEGNYIAEINANQRASLYQVICAEPGSILEWSIWHRGRRGIDVANVKIGVSLNSAAIEETMSTDQNAWQKYSGSYTVPAGEHTVYFVFESVSSQPFNNLSYGNLIDNFKVTKTFQGTCPVGVGSNNGLLTVVNPNYYTKIGNSNGSVAWYFDELNAPAPMRVTPNGTYNSSSRIQMNNNSPAYGVSSGNNPVFENNLLDFSSAFQNLRANAINMASNSNTAVLEDDSSNSITNTTLTSQSEIFLNNGVNYLNVTGSDLNNVDSFTFQNSPSATKILIVNVDASGNFNWDTWEQLGITPAESPYVLYNFYNTTDLYIEGSETIYGTIFAPFANVNKIVNKEDIYGQVIAKSFIHDGGVIHCNKFAAASTCPAFAGVAPSPSFDINVNPQCFVANDFVFTNTTDIVGVPQPEAPITYLWNFGDGTNSTSMDVTKTYATEGTYTVSLTATNIYGSETYSEQVTVLPVLKPIVSVVNLPSPAGKIIKQFTIDNASSFTDFSWTLPGTGPQSGPGLLQNINPITYEFSEAGIFTISVTATSNDCTITLDVIVNITSSEVTGGNSGGIESESLGDAISKIYVNRKKNSVPTEFVKSENNLYSKSKMKSAQPYQGKGQTLLDMFPTELFAGNIANVTSPTDILDYTVADEVLSVDFSLDGKTKGVVLGIKTTDKIYNHTKASCDRLRGAEILNIQTVQLEGYNFLMQGIKQRNGIVEYAISFATAKNNNDANYTIQTNWYVNNYIKFNDVYNFQVWSTNPGDTQKMVVDIIKNLNAFIPVNQTEIQKVPETYAAKISRDKADLVILMRSTEKGLSTELSMQELYSETANNVKYRYNPINSELEQTLRVNIADGYEYDALVKVNGTVEDAFYHADGNWGLDFDKTYTKIEEYFVSNDFNRVYNDDEYAINRNVKIKATSNYDYLTVYKSLLPGTLSADYSEYKYLAFTAKGSGMMELGLIKASIEDWKAQYRVMVDFSEEEQSYYVPFDIFASSASQEKLTPKDLTTLLFTFLPVEVNNTKLDLEISDVRFTKTAVEDQIVNKIEKFENEFMAYPNPSQGNVNLLLFSKTETEATVTLSDITGKIIYSKKATLNAGKNELDFNFKVKTGVMLLNVTSPETNYGTIKVLFR